MSDLTDRRKIHNRHTPHESYDWETKRWARAPHPLDGYTVAQFVAQARAGWPKVPVPADPFKAAQRVMKTHSGAVEYADTEGAL